MNTCVNIRGLSQELGILGKPLCKWRDRLEEDNPASLCSREFILSKEINKLKRLLANKTMEVEFFRGALQRVRA
jgi:hypothetical protein